MEKNNRGYIPDSRFGILGKDALNYVIAWVIYFFATLAITAFLGAGDPVNYTYICGLPLWYFAFLVLQLGFMGYIVYMLKKKYANVSLDADDPNYKYEEDK